MSKLLMISVTYDIYYAGFVFLMSNETREAFDQTLFNKNIGNILITPERFSDNQEQAIEELAAFYTTGDRQINSSLDLLRAYSAAIGDAMLTIPALEEAKTRIDIGSPTWLVLGTFRDNLSVTTRTSTSQVSRRSPNRVNLYTSSFFRVNSSL